MYWVYGSHKGKKVKTIYINISRKIVWGDRRLKAYHGYCNGYCDGYCRIRVYLPGFQCSTVAANNTSNITDPHYKVTCRPSEGVYYRCKQSRGYQHCGSFAVEGFSTDSSMFPTAWKVAVVFMSAGVFVSFLMSAMAVSSFCKQAIRKKSMFGLAGSGQGLAGEDPYNIMSKLMNRTYVVPWLFCVIYYAYRSSLIIISTNPSRF